MRKCAPHPNVWQRSPRFAQLRHGRQRSGYSSLVRIDETKTARLTFNQIDRDEVLTAVRRRKAGCSFFPGIVAFSRNLLSSIVINDHRNFFSRLGGANREPVMISRIEIHCDEGVIVRLNGPAPMAISDLETVVGKCAGKIERGLARLDFNICLGTPREADS